MKVLLVNGSPHEKGCTFTALSEIKKTLESENIEAEIFHIGTNPVRGCIGCGGCAKNNGKCVFNDDVVNEVNEHSYIETHEKVLPLMHIFQSTLYKYFELIFMKRKSSY